jgi:GalNAc-alpha-(1->4)-GalNAc-alpha-(1->3)-diNAcBac-PP-undecaprenol alpha-1,4-N-acetyl-D-galactosaminyltransferase
MLRMRTNRGAPGTAGPVPSGVAATPIGARAATAVGEKVREKKKLVLVIAHLGPGGAQRVVANAVEVLAERGLELHVIVFTDRADAYPIDPRVECHFWSPRRGSRGTVEPNGKEGDSDLQWPTDAKPGIRSLRRFVPNGIAFSIELIRISAWLRRTIQRLEPDAVLSFLTQTNIMTVLATRGLDVHTVISERNDPRLQRHRPRIELLRRLVYRRADVVTANSRGALTALEAIVPKDKLAFLPNPLMAAATSEATVFAAPTVITVGRLVAQKGLDVLLAAWAMVVEMLPDWRLAVVGGGPLEAELRALAAKLNIANSVDWIGQVRDPFPLLRGAEFFVLTSRFEGTPNALLEAMACGLPAIVSDASPGPCELIGPDGSAGLIVAVEDARATAEAIIRLARDEALRRRLGLAARERARAHEADRAIEVWLRLLRCE